MKTKLLILTVAIIAAFIWARSIQAEVKYVDTTCPICGSNEVLDFGNSKHGQKCYCFDCNHNYIINQYQNEK